MSNFVAHVIQTNASKTTLIIRIMAGAVFLPEGLQKLIYPSVRRVGRFESIGFPAPEFFGPLEVRELSTYGFWSMAHEVRTDFAMFLGSLFLMIKGGGSWSLIANFHPQKLIRNSD